MSIYTIDTANLDILLVLGIGGPSDDLQEPSFKSTRAETKEKCANCNNHIKFFLVVFKIRDMEMTRKCNRIPAIKSSGCISGKAIIFTISTGDPEAPG